MQEAIATILSSIRKGFIFDSHYIINCLIRFHSDEYLEFASGINADTGKTLAVHGLIGKEIAKFENKNTISRLKDMAWSENIHGNSSECTAWIKN